MDDDLAVAGRAELVADSSVGGVDPDMGGGVPEPVVRGRGDRFRTGRCRDSEIDEVMIIVGDVDRRHRMTLGDTAFRFDVLDFIADSDLIDSLARPVNHQNRCRANKTVTVARGTTDFRGIFFGISRYTSRAVLSSSGACASCQHRAKHEEIMYILLD